MKKMLTAFILMLTMVWITPALAGQGIEQNKTNAQEFLQKLIGDRDYEGARKYVGPNYIQHDPRIAQDGFDPLVEALETNPLWKNRPMRKVQFLNVAGDGDVVYASLPREFKTPDGHTKRLLVVHVFRFDANGKIDEHWSAATHVDMAKTKNKHPLF